jgi:hypothetical protein
VNFTLPRPGVVYRNITMRNVTSTLQLYIGARRLAGGHGSQNHESYSHFAAGRSVFFNLGMTYIK